MTEGLILLPIQTLKMGEVNHSPHLPGARQKAREESPSPNSLLPQDSRHSGLTLASEGTIVKAT